MARKKKAGGHHGGAWKVAYADFVTAMMAFFMVLWILGLNAPVKQAISAYFNDPMVFLKTKQEKGPSAIKVEQPFKPPEARRQRPNLGISRKKGDGVDEQKLFKNLKAEIERLFLSDPKLEEFRKNIHLEMTREGLRIDLFEEKEGAFFSAGSGSISPLLQQLIRAVCAPLKQIINPLIVEGHTDAKPTNYSRVTNWEISAERANAARRILEDEGLGEQIAQVRGLAANKPFIPADPMHPANRRISLLAVFSGLESIIATPTKGLFSTGDGQEPVPGLGLGPTQDPSLEPAFGPKPVSFASPTLETTPDPIPEKQPEEPVTPQKKPVKKYKNR